jgi:calcineurin-like phosphoesterase
VVVWAYAHRGPERIIPAIIPGDRGPAVTVEVLNATAIDGLAREIARKLRRQGIDVVYFGAAGRHDLDSTMILIRRGDSTAAVAVRNALGSGRVALELDPQRLLDISVVVGRDAASTLDRHP